MTTRLKSPEAAARWLGEWVTGTLRTDSRRVLPGDAFIAWPGYANDGRQFVRAALAAGATTCLIEREGAEAFAFVDARIASLPSLKASAGPIAHAFFEAPSSALDVIASTGTNGKTSTAWWTAQALTALGRRCGVVGTLGVGEPPLGGTEARIEFTGLTTPDPVALHATFRRFVDAGFSACAIEASSIGIAEHRLAGSRIKVALYTNFTQDHLDYHGSMQAYWDAKHALFSWAGLRAAVLNLDDPHGAVLADELHGSRLDLWTYAVQQGQQLSPGRSEDSCAPSRGVDAVIRGRGSTGPARLRALNLGYDEGGLCFDVQEGRQVAPVRSTLIGDYNASNLLAVLGALRALGVSLADAARVVPLLTSVPGRMQRVGGADGPQVVVDYAHTPDALEKALVALRPLAASRAGRLICVFGCGGNRDATKRPLMGAVAERHADAVVLTSDNPRGEPPAHILQQMAAGLTVPAAAMLIEDRQVAIATTLREAEACDVVLIAGKGHEDYQEIAGIKHPFSDLVEAQAALRARKDNP
jgi:UDP-N-acetylmuramoyl-L-alanyl-D-glutamate--2,6-diaminopimelate ligase